MKRNFLSLTVLMASWALPVTLSAQINTERVLTVGRNALYFEDYVLSIQYFNQVIRAKPYMAQPYLLRALAKYNLDDFDGAVADATLALERNPFLPDAWEVRAVSHQNLGQNTLAIADYAKALELLPRNRQMLFNMALAQTESGDFAAADSSFTHLLEYYPKFDAGHVGRAQLHLAQADTVAARADLDRALQINANSSQALVLRSIIEAEAAGGNLHDALADMDQAIKLQPGRVPLRINRAVIRYKLDDLNGAMEDFNYVVESEPMNLTALYNRALLRMELGDNDLALTDLDRVLEITPDDHRALYNRALILGEKGEFDRALTDINAIIATYPALDAGYSLRAHIHAKAGNMAAARADMRRAEQLMHSQPVMASAKTDASAQTDNKAPDSKAPDAKDVSTRFHAMLTLSAENETELEQKFNNASIRGRVQDKDANVELQPIYTLSYYTAGNAAGTNGMLAQTVYTRDLSDINDARTLQYAVYMTNSLPSFIRDEEINRHFASIQRYGSVLAGVSPRAIDYFGRAMDYVTTRNYASAIEDLDRAIVITPDFAMAYFLRGVARYKQLEARRGSSDAVTEDVDENIINSRNRITVNQILSDWDTALEYSPELAPALFNRGTLQLQMQQYEQAIESFTRAIELAPDMGAAYYNRGYAYLSIGNRDAATADISRAGQLGIMSGYRLLKKASQLFGQ